MAKKITVATDAAPGKENVTVTTAAKPADAGAGTAAEAAEIKLHLATGKTYTEDDIADILKAAGYDYSVKLTDSQAPDGDKDGKILFNVKNATGVDVAVADGKGVGKDVVPTTGKGLTFQIGANGVEDQRELL
mgnify:FL=1